MSIASKLEKLATDITSAYGAINTKGGTIPSNKNTENLANAITSIPQGSSPTLQTKSVTITQNGSTSVTPDTGYDGLSSVAITTNVSGGGGSVEEKDVNFYDYDGTLTNSYTKTEFLALTELPENPTHQGLTSQGWNWSLADAKAFVNTYNEILDIGQMYITNDGKTRIYITLDNKSFLSPYVGFAINGTATIEWGDGTSDTVTGTSTSKVIYTQHTYSNTGNYVIKLSSTNLIDIIGFAGSFNCCGLISSNDEFVSKIYPNSVTNIELGSNIRLGLYALGGLSSLKTITIPKGISLAMHSYFYQCYSLKYLCIPDNVTATYNNMCAYCYGLEKVILPNNLTNLAYGAFSSCYSLERVTIPRTVATIYGGVFNNCYSLKEITLPSNITFSSASSLLGSAYQLKSVNLPSSLTVIPSSMFYYCYTLKRINFTGNVTSIASSAFSSCKAVTCFDFTNCTTVPTLANVNAFSNTTGKIVVPNSLYNDWITASNWSNLSSRIIKVSEA